MFMLGFLSILMLVAILWDEHRQTFKSEQMAWVAIFLWVMDVVFLVFLSTLS
jgi:hypothetical protein